MYTIETSRHFKPYKDSLSGVVSYILRSHTAALEQAFYFINSGMSEDGRYFWFYCADPPKSGHYLAVLDFESDEITAYPDVRGSGFYVHPTTGDLFWGTPRGIMTRPADPRGESRMLVPLTGEIAEIGIGHLGTHLTFTPDGREIVADMYLNSGGSSIGSFAVATGEYHEWYRTDLPYNHAQVCPTNGDLCLCAHEYYEDPVTKKLIAPALTPEGIYPRLQLITRDGQRTMLIPHCNSATHECWSPDGKSVFYISGAEDGDGPIKGQQVIARDHLDGKPAETVGYLPIEGGCGCWHSHCTKDGRYFVVDGALRTCNKAWWRGTRSITRFYDTKTGKLTNIISENPVVNDYSPENPCGYHIDPHPRFVCGDTLITHTVTVNGKVEAAITPTAQLFS